MESDQVSAIVLAGGRSTRFGADKLAARVGGRTLLDRAVDAVAQLANEVIVVEAAGGGQEAGGVHAAEGEDSADGAHMAEEHDRGHGGVPGVRIVHDTTPGAGPLAGLRDGAAVATGARLLVVAGDMPTLRPGVLRLLLAALASDVAVDAAILSPAPAPHPPIHPLPMAIRRAPALSAAARLLAADQRSLRGLLDALHTTPIPAATWLALDPDAATLRDIDTPADLAALEIDPPG